MVYVKEVGGLVGGREEVGGLVGGLVGGREEEEGGLGSYLAVGGWEGRVGGWEGKVGGWVNHMVDKATGVGEKRGREEGVGGWVCGKDGLMGSLGSGSVDALLAGVEEEEEEEEGVGGFLSGCSAEKRVRL